MHTLLTQSPCLLVRDARLPAMHTCLLTARACRAQRPVQGNVADVFGNDVYMESWVATPAYFNPYPTTARALAAQPAPAARTGSSMTVAVVMLCTSVRHQPCAAHRAADMLHQAKAQQAPEMPLCFSTHACRGVPRVHCCALCRLPRGEHFIAGLSDGWL